MEFDRPAHLRRLRLHAANVVISKGIAVSFHFFNILEDAPTQSKTQYLSSLKIESRANNMIGKLVFRYHCNYCTLVMLRNTGIS